MPIKNTELTFECGHTRIVSGLIKLTHMSCKQCNKVRKITKRLFIED